MRELRALIVDDEPIARQLLLEELAEVEGVTVVGEAENGQQALDKIRQLSPDLVLLDIQMPGFDGFEVIRRLHGPLPSLVFVTAYSEHAIRAFDVGVVDCVLKPVTSERLRAAVERARKARSRPLDTAERVAQTVNAASPGLPRQTARIVARSGRDYHLLALDEIFAFQAEGEIVWILTAGKKYMATQTVQALEKRLLGTEFLRVHRGMLINTNKIRKMSALSSQRWQVILTNGVKVTVSKRRAPAIREILR